MGVNSFETLAGYDILVGDLYITASNLSMDTKQQSKVKNNRIVFVLAALTVVIVGASVDIFVPSLPFIQRTFQSSVKEAQLIVAAYLVSYGLFQLIAGGVSDSFGRRKTLLFSLAGFIISTACVPFSQNIETLLALRFFQGMFAAGIGVSSRVLVSDSFSGIELAKHATYLTFAWAMGPVFSPYLGGYLQHLFGWKASFLFLGGYSFIVAMLVFFWLPETAPTRHRFHIKTISTHYFKIFVCWPFIAGALVCGCAYSFITIYNVAGPFLIERILGYSSVVYGRIALFLGVSWLSGNLLCRYIVTRKDANRKIYTGLILAVFISIVMLWLANSGYFNLWTACIPPMLLFVVGGMLFSYCFGKCLSIFPLMGGAASAAMGALYSVMAAGVSALSTLLKATTLTPLALSYLFVTTLVFLFFYLRNGR